MSINNKYTIRVYGLLINENQEILLTDEIFQGMEITKFPGGGMEKGEGTIDTLKREFMEETGIEIEVKQHFYTTDFYQAALQNPDIQLISIYYFVEPISSIAKKNLEKFIENSGKLSNGIKFKFEKISDLQINDITLPIDKKVLQLLQEIN